MRNTIKEIHKKYNDAVFRMAISHLFSKGIETLEKNDVDKNCEYILKNTPDNSIISGTMLADVHRCACELAKIDLWDILKFIQTDIQIDHIHTHPGTIIRFYNEVTEKQICCLLISAEATDADINEVLDEIWERKLLKPSYMRSTKAILEVFDQKGVSAIEITELEADHVIDI